MSNAANWQVETSWTGGGNDELQEYRPGNVTFTSGGAQIKAWVLPEWKAYAASGYSATGRSQYLANGGHIIPATLCSTVYNTNEYATKYASGKLISQRAVQGYGGVEFTVVLPPSLARVGVWPSAMMLPAEYAQHVNGTLPGACCKWGDNACATSPTCTGKPSDGWPWGGEIDIMEIRGSQPTTNNMIIHFGTAYNTLDASNVYSHAFTDNQSTGAYMDGTERKFACFWNESGMQWFSSEGGTMSLQRLVSWSDSTQRSAKVTYPKYQVVPFVPQTFMTTGTVQMNNPFKNTGTNWHLVLSLAIGGWFDACKEDPGLGDVTQTSPLTMQLKNVTWYTGY